MIINNTASACGYGNHSNTSSEVGPVSGSGLGSVIGPVTVWQLVRPDLPVRSGVRPDPKRGGPAVQPDLNLEGPVIYAVDLAIFELLLLCNVISVRFLTRYVSRTVRK